MNLDYNKSRTIMNLDYNKTWIIMKPAIIKLDYNKTSWTIIKPGL